MQRLRTEEPGASSSFDLLCLARRSNEWGWEVTIAMWMFELMSWVGAGLAAGAVFTAMAHERRTRREIRIGTASAVVAGFLGKLADSPRPLSFSVLSVLVALGGAGCVLLLDWLNVEDRALKTGQWP
jgi:hypothetical protein